MENPPHCPLFLLAAALIIAVSVDLQPVKAKTLQFSGDSPFKIALFADLHYGESAWIDWGPKQDDSSDKVMAAVLDRETPDFVVYLGDVVTANNLPIPNASLYWDRAISPTRSRGIPWSTIFGNHDDAPFEWPPDWFSTTGIPGVRCPPENVTGEEECSFRGAQRIELMGMEVENNMLSYSVNGPKELWPSVSNYVLQISSSQVPNLPIVFLYFLDSGGGTYPEVISNAQVKWFQSRSLAINPYAKVPELIFWHIPSKAYKKIAPIPIFQIHKPCVGSINDEKVAAQEAEWGIMDFLIAKPSVKAIFVGHNHGLDWCCPYKNLWLCFARHTGYGGYGDWPRGARMIEITEDPFSIKSWIRMEDGTKHSDVILSSSPSCYSIEEKRKEIDCTVGSMDLVNPSQFSLDVGYEDDVSFLDLIPCDDPIGPQKIEHLAREKHNKCWILLFRFKEVDVEK